MWRCYANDGKGVAIGLNYSELKSILNDKLTKIEYASHGELKKRLISGGIKQMLHGEDKLPLSRLLYEVLSYKHPSFSAEKEWRIASHSLEQGFGVSNGFIKPYIEFRIPTSAIEIITFGPKCEFTKNKVSIYRMLKDKISPSELDKIKIINSQIPLI